MAILGKTIMFEIIRYSHPVSYIKTNQDLIINGLIKNYDKILTRKNRNIKLLLKSDYF